MRSSAILILKYGGQDMIGHDATREKFFQIRKALCRNGFCVLKLTIQKLFKNLVLTSHAVRGSIAPSAQRSAW